MGTILKKTMTITAAMAVTLSACATTPTPTARKLSPELVQKLNETPVVLKQNEEGIRAGWTSAGAAQPGYNSYVYVPPGTSPAAAGIGAAIGQAIAVALLDAAPSARASKSVATLNMGLEKSTLDAMLKEKIIKASAKDGVSFSDVEIRGFDRKDEPPQDAVFIETAYTLAEDASAVRVEATVTYHNDALSYQTPYDFGGKPPKAELSGPLYRNVFNYQSDVFETPEMTDDLREQLKLAAITAQKEAIEEAKAIEDEKKREKALSKAKKNHAKLMSAVDDDKLSKTELATLLIDKWRGQESPALINAITDGQEFVAMMIAKDLNDSSVPQFETKEPKPQPGFWKGLPPGLGPIGHEEYTVLETYEDGRRIIRVDSGYGAGQYYSIPEAGFASFGNTYKSAP